MATVLINKNTAGTDDYTIYDEDETYNLNEVGFVNKEYDGFVGKFDTLNIWGDTLKDIKAMIMDKDRTVDFVQDGELGEYHLRNWRYLSEFEDDEFKFTQEMPCGTFIDVVTFEGLEDEAGEEMGHILEGLTEGNTYSFELGDSTITVERL